MRVLITGACGFVGRKLAAEMHVHGHELTLLTHSVREMTVNGRTLPTLPCDVRDEIAVRRAVVAAKPQAIAHLAGLAQVVEAARDRDQLVAVNTLSVHHLCAAVAALPERSSPVPILFASSSFVYGDDFSGPTPISETSPLRPATPYGESKLAAESIGRCYESAQISFYAARPFNHIGPGQAPSFVCPGFAQRILNTEAGGTIQVGNLSSQRDFCDVRDIVRAYRLILEKRPASRTFVLGSGKPVSIETILSTLVALSGKDVRTRVDPLLYRPDDKHVLWADTALAERELGWRAQISLQQSLGDLYRSLAEHGKIVG